MQPQLRISQNAQELLHCPICHAKLKLAAQQFECVNSECDTRYPILDGVPVLLNDQSSVFSIADSVSHWEKSAGTTRKNGLEKAIRRFIPTIDRSVKGSANYSRFSELLLRQSSSPRVLVVGGETLGQGMETLANDTSFDLVESDVSFGPRTMLICDAHDIPFDDGSFDGVIVQAVLEHVVDPSRCVEEIHRVLRENAVVYAETPFMQQVHLGPYDFTRFTHSGHRRLFGRFDEIDSGAVCGPGMALAWSYQYFLQSFTTSKILGRLATCFARLTSFYLKYFDGYLIDKPATLDAASGFYFIGRKRDEVLSDRDLIRYYRGAR